MDVHRPEGVFDPLAYLVVLTAEVATDLHRVRQMTLRLFKSFNECLEKTRWVLPRMVADLREKEVPAYPDAINSSTAQNAAFRIDLAMSRREDGTLTTTLAAYDLENESAPMLLATDDEIEELCVGCVELVRVCAVEE